MPRCLGVDPGLGKGWTTVVASSTLIINPLRSQLFCASTPLRIGYYETDGYFLLPPCMRRAVRETRDLLQEAGHTVSPAVPTSCSEAASLLSPAAAVLQGCIVFMVQGTTQQRLAEGNWKWGWEDGPNHVTGLAGWVPWVCERALGLVTWGAPSPSSTREPGSWGRGAVQVNQVPSRGSKGQAV